MRRRGLITALVGSALALGLSACLAPWRERQVRLAIVDWPAYQYFYLASRQGLDREQGFSLKVDQFGSLQDQRNAFSRGDVDAIATTLPEALAICREVPVRCPVIVLVLDDSNGADQLIGPASLRSPAELKGQHIHHLSGNLAGAEQHAPTRIGQERIAVGHVGHHRIERPTLELGDQGFGTVVTELKIRQGQPQRANGTQQHEFAEHAALQPNPLAFELRG